MSIGSDRESRCLFLLQPVLSVLLALTLRVTRPTAGPLVTTKLQDSAPLAVSGKQGGKAVQAAPGAGGTAEQGTGEQQAEDSSASKAS